MNVKYIILLVLVSFSLGHYSPAMAQATRVVVIPLGADEVASPSVANGIDFTEISDTNLSTADVFVVVDSIEVDAPQSGYVVVNFSTNFFSSVGGTPIVCLITQNDEPPINVINAQIAVSGFMILNQNFTIGYPVNAGVNSFVVTCAQQSGDTNTTSARSTFMTAIFAADRL